MVTCCTLHMKPSPYLGLTHLHFYTYIFACSSPSSAVSAAHILPDRNVKLQRHLIHQQEKLTEESTTDQTISILRLPLIYAGFYRALWYHCCFSGSPNSFSQRPKRSSPFRLHHCSVFCLFQLSRGLFNYKYSDNFGTPSTNSHAVIARSLGWPLQSFRRSYRLSP